MSSDPREPTEEELQAAYEAELKRLRVEHVLLDNVAALANLGMRRTGLAPGTEAEQDPEQVRLAIESIRALLPVLEQVAPAQIGAIREGFSQLQLAFVRIGGQGPLAETPGKRCGCRAGRRCRCGSRPRFRLRFRSRFRARPERWSGGFAGGPRPPEAGRARAGAAQRPALGCPGSSRLAPSRPPRTLKSRFPGLRSISTGGGLSPVCWLRLRAPSL